MNRLFARAAVLLVVLLLVSCAGSPSDAADARLTVSQALGKPANAAFARATQPRVFVFPQDHGPHPTFATEWWYYTGNLDSQDGRRFGYQLTFFRFGLTPDAPARGSAWAANSIYMAHLALSDIGTQKFYAFERFSRGAVGLAGAQSSPLQVWLEDWRMDAGPDGVPMRLTAAQGDIALDLTLEAGKGIVLQGDHGLSQKSAEPGNASFYYSMPRMPSSGMLRIAGQEYQVRGQSWLDREWSTSALGNDQVGWDWFALQLEDGRELMYYRLRLRDGSEDAYSAGSLTGPQGELTRLSCEDVQIEVLDRWQSPAGTSYPVRWRIRIPTQALELQVQAAMPDQELALSVRYWEGAVDVTGSIKGRGYVELTGYADGSGQNPRGR